MDRFEDKFVLFFQKSLFVIRNVCRRVCAQSLLWFLLSLGRVCVVVLCTAGRNCFFALLLELLCIIAVVFGTGSLMGDSNILAYS